ncbi:hypothetical protein TNCV_1083151 [Trichonephila clavipes]|nr:hypothetical protein TNCV_1083151 [Trichonephila clavipes]
MLNNCRVVSSVHTPDSIVLRVLKRASYQWKGISPSADLRPVLKVFGIFGAVRVCFFQFAVRFRPLPGRRSSLPSSLKRQIASDTVCRGTFSKRTFVSLAKQL